MNTIDSQLLQQVGNHLKALRQQQRMSLEDVKVATGIAVAKIEQGEKDIKVNVLAELCDHYRVSMIDFFKAIEKQMSK